MNCLICGARFETLFDGRGNLLTFPGSVSDYAAAESVERAAVPFSRGERCTVPAAVCPACHGSGSVGACAHIATVCDACDGTGRCETSPHVTARVCISCAADELDAAARWRARRNR